MLSRFETITSCFWIRVGFKCSTRCLGGTTCNSCSAMVPVSGGIGLVTTLTKTVNVKQSKEKVDISLLCNPL